MICVGMVFFLPDLRARTATGVQDVYQKIPQLFLAPHLPPPPAAGGAPEHEDETAVGPRPMIHSRDQDKEKLYQKIKEDLEQESRRVLEKPKFVHDGPSSSSSSTPSGLGLNKGPLSHQLEEPHRNAEGNHHGDEGGQEKNPDGAHGGGSALFPAGESYFHRTKNFSSLILNGGEDSDPVARERRDFIKKVS